MYEKFYGFSEKPFQIVPNPNFLYLAPKHQSALTYLEYGITEGVGFVLLTGEIGTGKTTLIRHILNQIESDIDVAVIFNTNVTPDQLICMILQEFELEPAENNKAKNLDTLYQFLIAKFAEGRRALLIIDEAQNLNPEALEEVRMLSNLQSDEQMLLQIMLVGQPELKAKLKKPSLAQLSQRISVSYHLTALNKDDTKLYIASRLKKVGGNEDIFTSAAQDKIYQASGGIPRTINIVCDSALVYGYADEISIIDAEIIAQVLEDKGGLGLEVGRAPDEEDIPATNEEIDRNYTIIEQRLNSLEENVQKLTVQINWQLEQSENKAGGLHDELVAELNQLLDKEREKTNNLLQENVLLKEKYSDQEEARELNKKVEVEESSAPSDLDEGVDEVEERVTSSAVIETIEEEIEEIVDPYGSIESSGESDTEEISEEVKERKVEPSKVPEVKRISKSEKKDINGALKALIRPASSKWTIRSWFKS